PARTIRCTSTTSRRSGTSWKVSFRSASVRTARARCSSTPTRTGKRRCRRRPAGSCSSFSTRGRRPEAARSTTAASTWRRGSRLPRRISSAERRLLRVAPGPADRPDLPAPSASAEELLAAVGLEPRDEHSGRHLQGLQHFPRSGIDPSQVALVAFPGAVPELAVDPGDTRDEAVGLDRAENRSGLGIDLIDLAVPILSDPERSLGPREPRVTARAGRRDRGEHAAGRWIDLLDAILGDLVQVLAIERGSGMRGRLDRSQWLAALRIEGDQLVSGGEPDALAVVRDAVHVVGARERTILADDLGV